MSRDAIPTTKATDMALGRAWFGQFFADAASLPISFLFNGRSISGIPAAWQPHIEQQRIDANLTETIFAGTDPDSGLHLRVESLLYHDYPVMEWVAWFTNTGETETPLLQDILAMDMTINGTAPQLYHCNGDFYSAEGYTPTITPLAVGTAVDFAPNGGRSCDGAFPYYRLIFADCGLTLAIGWPAQWQASFTAVADGVHVRAGQEKTHLRLQPGERIRTPRMTALAWRGDSTRAVNLWRRWYHAHLLPRPNGRPLQPLLACSGTDEGEEFTAATEANQLRYMAEFKARGIDFDLWWIDAGWYPCYNQNHERKWPITGSWIADPERFPNGLKPVADKANDYGADLLLWFEPERVRPGTMLDVEHPEWLLRLDGSENSLLNLGDPLCRQWLTDHLCHLIQDYGVKIYRQDHNFPPLAYWRQNEPADRQGINENLHIQGYLQFWDELLARNPGLWIDSCASGGRRNDLETMRRSVPLHYTDYGYGDHPVKLAFHHTLLGWIPYFKEVTLSWDLDGNARFDHQVDSYSYHCGLGALLGLGLDIRRTDYDYLLAGKLIEMWRRAADLLLYGDYYPHTPFQRSADAWVARQFDLPERACGFIQAIRLPAAPQAHFTMYVEGLELAHHYYFENPESGETQAIAGEDLLRDGFTFALPARSGAIWFYRRTHR